MFTQDNLDRVLNGHVIGSDGEKIGKVGDIYFDDVTNKPSWATVNTGLFGTSNSFVPLDNSSMEGDDIRVPFTKEKVKDAPRVDADRHLSVEEERELYRYYGSDFETGYADYQNDPDRGADHGADGQAGVVGGRRDVVAGDRTTDPDRGADHGADAAAEGGVVLHEERVNVGTERREAGKVRLRKHVVTERQTVNVPVTHEEVHIEREPIRDGHVADDGRAFKDETAEVTLTEDRVVVNKEAVATERVSLGKDVVTEQRQVTEDVRREEVDIDRTGVQGRDGVVGRDGVADRDYDNDGKVGLGDKIKDKLDRDNDGKIGR